MTEIELNELANDDEIEKVVVGLKKLAMELVLVAVIAVVVGVLFGILWAVVVVAAYALFLAIQAALIERKVQKGGE